MAHMDRFFIGKQSSAQDFSHPLKTDAFNKTMLFTHSDFMDHLGGKSSDKELPTKKERGAIPKLISSFSKETRRVFLKSEGQQRGARTGW
jgi:hypothetical protein